MTPKRVAIVSDWFAPRQGGIESQLLQLCDQLAARGHVVNVFTTTPGARDGRAFGVTRLDLLRLPVQDVAVSPRMLSRLREAVRGHDVVHAHVSVVSPLGYAAAYAARSLGLPAVVTFHSVLRAKALLLRAANWAGALSRSGVLWTAVSRHVATQAMSALTTPVSVLSNGIDLRYWRATRRSAMAMEPVTLVSTMRLQRKKRPRQLVRAFANAVARSGVPARLVIIGDGPARRAVERDVDLYRLRAGPSSIVVRGWQERDACRDAYQTAHGFTLASSAESFGIAALEARSAGLPVVTMQGGSSEFLTHGEDALLCEDDAEFEVALARFIGDAALRQRLASHVTDLSRYDWAQVALTHERAYDEAIRIARADADALPKG